MLLMVMLMRLSHGVDIRDPNKINMARAVKGT